MSSLGTETKFRKGNTDPRNPWACGHSRHCDPVKSRSASSRSRIRIIHVSIAVKGTVCHQRPRRKRRRDVTARPKAIAKIRRPDAFEEKGASRLSSRGGELDLWDQPKNRAATIASALRTGSVKKAVCSSDQSHARVRAINPIKSERKESSQAANDLVCRRIDSREPGASCFASAPATRVSGRRWCGKRRVGATERQNYYRTIRRCSQGWRHR